MPLHWTVSHEQELVHAIATGELNTDDLQAYLGAIIAAQAMPAATLVLSGFAAR